MSLALPLDSSQRGRTSACWAFSMSIHGLLIGMAVVLLAEMPPPPPPTFKWNVAVVQPPAPVPEPAPAPPVESQPPPTPQPVTPSKPKQVPLAKAEPVVRQVQTVQERQPVQQLQPVQKAFPCRRPKPYSTSPPSGLKPSLQPFKRRSVRLLKWYRPLSKVPPLSRKRRRWCSTYRHLQSSRQQSQSRRQRRSNQSLLRLTSPNRFDRKLFSVRSKQYSIES